MASHIHETAIIDSSAQIGNDVVIGPYSIIKNDAIIGDGVILDNSVTIGPYTELGPGVKVHPGAVVGGDPQDLKFRDETTFAKIGAGTVIRECVTVNRGTEEGSVTMIGTNCYIMAYSHIAHNCTIGDNVIIANVGTIAGHVTIHDNAILGGMVGIHQFCRIGTMAIVGGCSKVVKDILPYASADGNPVKIRTINAIGLTRKGYTRSQQQDIRQAYKILFDSKLKFADALKKLRLDFDSPEVTEIRNFIDRSERGIVK